MYPLPMSDDRGVSQIEADLLAREERGRDSWEVHDSAGSLGRVVKTVAGYVALRPGPSGDYYSVGTFISLESAGKALRS